MKINEKDLDKVNAAIRKGLEKLKIRPPMLASDWANNFFYLSPESSGIAGKFQCLPYQTAILNWMGSDDIELVAIMKCRRAGFTKMFMAGIGYFLHQKRRNIGCFQPTDSDRDRFSRVEIDTAIRDCPALSELMLCSIDSRSKNNTTEYKAFRGCALNLKGGKSPKNFRAMSLDVLVIDELSAFDPDCGGEGSPVSLGQGRLDASPFPKTILGSTPKLRGSCLTEAEVLACEHIFERHVDCLGCGVSGPIRWDDFVWEDDNPETVCWKCPKCGHLHTYADLPKLDGNGRWRSDSGLTYSESDDFFRDDDGDVVKKPRKIGVRTWAGYSYFRTWAFIVEAFIEAGRAEKAGDVTKMISFVNTLLGETYEDKTNVAETGELLSRAEPYTADCMPDEVLCVVAGIDVQDGKDARAEVSFWGFGLDRQMFFLDHKVVFGDITNAETKQLILLTLRTKFARRDGVQLGCRGAFIDSGNGRQTAEIYRFTAQNQAIGLFATKGVTTGSICNPSKWAGDLADRSRCVLKTCNINIIKSILFQRLKIKEGSGVIRFPDTVNEQFFAELCSEELRHTIKNGRRTKPIWVKKDGVRNEILDCCVYAIACFTSLGLDLELLNEQISSARGKAVPGTLVEAGGIEKRKVGTLSKGLK
jgi:phage terminase large subunit GpA-like protein